MKRVFVWRARQLEAAVSAGDPCRVFVLPGLYLIKKTILVSSNTELCGMPFAAIRLSRKSNCFVISNYPEPAENISIRNLAIFGGGHKNQHKPEGSRISWGHGMYFWKAKDLRLERCIFFGIAQTAIQLFECDEVRLRSVAALGTGWSGLATSGTTRLSATRFVAVASGRAERHSAIHFDGGSKVFLRQTWAMFSSGNGLMWDNSWSSMSHSLAAVKALACLRGASYSGHPDKAMTSISTFVTSVKCDTGVLVSNAQSVHFFARSLACRIVARVQGKNSFDVNGWIAGRGPVEIEPGLEGKCTVQVLGSDV